MRIDIVLDVVCPWCCIGKRRLELALARRPEIVPEFVFRPFQLNPDMPEGGMAREDYLAAKFGGGQHAGRVYQTVSEAGSAIGLEFAFERIRRTPPTRAAHRLVWFAARTGQASVLVDALFRAYFRDGRDLGNPTVLAAIAAQAGLDPDAARQVLAGTDGLADVIADEHATRRAGISAVPCFIFDGQYAISGAQEPEFFLPVFDLVRNGMATA